MKDERMKLLKLSKMERNKAYYEKMKGNKKVCDVCCCEVISSYWQKHQETARHQKFSELKQRMDAEEPKKKRGRKPTKRRLSNE